MFDLGTIAISLFSKYNSVVSSGKPSGNSFSFFPPHQTIVELQRQPGGQYFPPGKQEFSEFAGNPNSTELDSMGH